MFRLLLLCLIACMQRPLVVDAEEVNNATKSTKIEGCFECGNYRCPEDPEKCLLGSATDPCGCCESGICAKLIGEPCWNSSIPELLAKRRNDGYCAENYVCQLRLDLELDDEPEAVCVCETSSEACGTNNQTYPTPCDLKEEAMRIKNSSLMLHHLGPCPSRPWIISAPDDVSSGSGQRVALNCETKGFPVPDIVWEFHSINGERVLKLPNNELPAVVNTRDGPESFMRTSWVLLANLQKIHAGEYYCIANNSIGEISTKSFVSLL